MPPVWLLDIDGVINALAYPPNVKTWPAHQWVEAAAASAHEIEWPLLAAQPVLQFLRDVHEQGRAEIRWHTTWQRHAVNVGAALALPLWPVHDCPEFYMDETQIAVPLTTKVSRWWKLPAAQRVLTEGRPLLWTDDDARYQLRRADVAAWGSRALVVSPSASNGLTRHHLRRINTWLTEQAI